jgi:hypothetical protein
MAKRKTSAIAMLNYPNQVKYLKPSQMAKRKRQSAKPTPSPCSTPNTMRKYPKPSQKAKHGFDFCLLRFAF